MFYKRFYERHDEQIEKFVARKDITIRFVAGTETYVHVLYEGTKSTTTD